MNTRVKFRSAQPSQVGQFSVGVNKAANHFEALLGARRRYRVEALTSLAEAWRKAHPGRPLPPDLDAQIVQGVAERFARVVPPHVHDGEDRDHPEGVRVGPGGAG